MPEMVHDHTAVSMTSLNSCCTVMWKANGKTTKLLLSWIVYFQNQEQNQDPSSGGKTIQRYTTPKFRSPVGSVSRGENTLRSYSKEEDKQKRRQD
jgi:hypothetical protein